MEKTYYETCPDCGAHLDPGEKCDCKAEAVKIQSPARIVTIKQLVAMGYPTRYVRRIVNDPRQTFAWRMHPQNPKSTYLIDLDKLEQYKERQIKLSR